jgi:hypothetical protein
MRIFLLLLGLIFHAASVAQTCASPGKDGPVTIAGADTSINTYF